MVENGFTAGAWMYCTIPYNIYCKDELLFLAEFVNAGTELLKGLFPSPNCGNEPPAENGEVAAHALHSVNFYGSSWYG